MRSKLLSVLGFTFICLSAQAQWTVQNSGFAQPGMEIFCISAPSAQVVWAAAYDTASSATYNGEYTMTVNGGATWTPSAVTGAQDFYISSIHALDQNNAWVIMNDAANGGAQVSFTSNGGTFWSTQSTAAFAAPDGFGNNIYFWNANEGVVTGDPNGGYWEIYTTSNGGVTWTRVPQNNIPAANSNEYGYENTYAVIGNTIWYGTTDGRIFKSIDKGLNWTVSQTALGGISQLAFRDANNGLASDGNAVDLLSTTDGGVNWNSISFSGNIFDYGLCYVGGTPNGYVMTGYGGSSCSSDDGATWIDLDQLDHTTVAFFNNTTGWSGGWNTSSTVAGMFKYSAGLGMNDQVNSGSVKVFPNPMTDAAFVYLTEDPRTAELILTDISGKVVQRITNISSKTITIHRDDLSAGLYLFSIVNENGSIGNGKLIVK